MDLRLETAYYKNQRNSINNFKNKYKIKDIVVRFPSPSLDLLEKYRYLLLSKSEFISLETKYHMRPDYLSYDKYGTDTLDFLLMYMNNCFTPEDFIFSNVYVPDYSSISTIIQDNITNNDFEIMIVDFDNTTLKNIQNKLLLEKVSKLAVDYFKDVDSYITNVN